MDTDTKTLQDGAGARAAAGYAEIQSHLLVLIGKASEATKAATNELELQAGGQLVRRLCHALTGL